MGASRGGSLLSDPSSAESGRFSCKVIFGPTALAVGSSSPEGDPRLQGRRCICLGSLAVAISSNVLPALDVDGLFAGKRLPAPDGGVDVVRIEFDAAADAARLLRRQQRGAAAQERVQDDAPCGCEQSFRASMTSGSGLHGRMDAQFLHASAA